MVVRKTHFRQSGSSHCKVTTGPLLGVSIFAQRQFDAVRGSDMTEGRSEYPQNSVITEITASVEIFLGVLSESNPEHTLVEDLHPCQRRSDREARWKITATNFLIFLSPTYRHTRILRRSAGSKRAVYLPFVRMRKRNIATTFAKPKAANFRALGPNGSGRGPVRP